MCSFCNQNKITGQAYQPTPLDVEQTLDKAASDDVLLANDRGHSAESVFKSSELIKSYGFSLGLQMMTGLYKSDIQKDLYTAETFVKINPDTVRIYPTVIMKDTKLAKLYLNGESRTVLKIPSIFVQGLLNFLKRTI